MLGGDSLNIGLGDVKDTISPVSDELDFTTVSWAACSGRSSGSRHRELL